MFDVENILLTYRNIRNQEGGNVQNQQIESGDLVTAQNVILDEITFQFGGAAG